MGEELSLARSEEEGRSVLLASTGSGELITTSAVRNKGTQEPAPYKGSKRGKIKDTKAKGKSSRKTKGANASPSKSTRRRRDNQDWKSDRGNEGEDKSARRSAQNMGVTFPSSYCDELEMVPHYWVGVEKIHEGSLYQCKFCRRYLWLPTYHRNAEYLGNLMKQYGNNEGYCHFLNRHRAAKMLIAKLQDLRRLATEIGDKREFARLADKIMSDTEYDRKEVK